MMGIFGFFGKKADATEEDAKRASDKAEFCDLYDEVMSEMRESKAQASLEAEKRSNLPEAISPVSSDKGSVTRKEFAVTGYIKKPDVDYEPVVLTGGKQIRELLGCTEGIKSVQVHTKKGYSVYANSEAEGNCTGHTVDITGTVRFWSGTFVVAKFSGKELISMDDVDLEIFKSEVMDKMRAEEEASGFSRFETSVEALREFAKVRKDENGGNDGTCE